MEPANFKTEVLIEKCASGDPLAWAEFVKRYSPFIDYCVKKVFMRYSPGAKNLFGSISDIRQNIFTNLWSKNSFSEIKNRSNINYWLAVTSRNYALNYLKSGRNEMLLSDGSFFEKIPAAVVDAESGALSPEEFAGKIEGVLSGLSARDKIVFKLYFEKKLKLKDIARMLRVPLGTVSSVVTRIRKKFKE